MNKFFKRSLVVVVLATLITPTVATAQKSAGGVVGDARLHPGTWSTQRTSPSRTRFQPQYQTAAPAAHSPKVVAQTPTERRSYSYEPSQSTEARTTTHSKSESCGCGNGVVIEKAQSATKPSTERQRSYSYEPSISEPSTAPQSYTAPRMQSSNSSHWQRTSGTKAERNNQRN